MLQLQVYALEQRYHEAQAGLVDERPAVWALWDGTSTDGAAFTKSIRKGVPHDLRRQAWKAMTEGIRQTIFKYRGGLSYADLIEQIESAAEPSKIAGTIELDLNRTFPGHTTIDSPEGQDKLRRILIAYSLRNPDVGYCQSMNYIAAGLMTVLEEEDAFWFLSMVEERILDQYHSAHILGVRTDCRLLLGLCELYLPELYKHLELNQVVPVRGPTSWTKTRHDGPNHLGL